MRAPLVRDVRSFMQFFFGWSVCCEAGGAISSRARAEQPLRAFLDLDGAGDED
jgi:hypothetical protein